jgi:hypothetical protein
MKTRRHHNNKGLRQIKNGKTSEQVKRMAGRLGIPFNTRSPEPMAFDPRDPEVIEYVRNHVGIVLGTLSRHFRAEKRTFTGEQVADVLASIGAASIDMPTAGAADGQ